MEHHKNDNRNVRSTAKNRFASKGLVRFIFKLRIHFCCCFVHTISQAKSPPIWIAYGCQDRNRRFVFAKKRHYKSPPGAGWFLLSLVRFIFKLRIHFCCCFVHTISQAKSPPIWIVYGCQDHNRRFVFAKKRHYKSPPGAGWFLLSLVRFIFKLRIHFCCCFVHTISQAKSPPIWIVYGCQDHNRRFVFAKKRHYKSPPGAGWFLLSLVRFVFKLRIHFCCCFVHTISQAKSPPIWIVYGCQDHNRRFVFAKKRHYKSPPGAGWFLLSLVRFVFKLRIHFCCCFVHTISQAKSPPIWIVYGCQDHNRRFVLVLDTLMIDYFM